MEMSKTQYKKETIAMAVLVVLSLVGFFFVIPAQIPETSAFSDAGGVGSRTIPYMVVVVIGVLAAAQIIKNLIIMARMEDEQDTRTEEEKKETRDNLIKTLILYGFFILFGLLFMYTGFLLAAVITLPAILYILGVREKGYYIGIIIFAGVTYVLFRYVLEVIVPLFSIGG